MTIEKLPEKARPFEGVVDRAVCWEKLLVDVLPHTAMEGLSLSRTNSAGVDGREDDAPPLVEISSGGSVFFCVLVDDEVVVLKFVSDRLLCQSEVFASEIAHYLGVNGPACRIMLPDSEEWLQLKAACYALHDKERGLAGQSDQLQQVSILHCLEKHYSLLVIEYIPGAPLLTSEKAIEDVGSIAYALGQVLALDIILGNPDRLCVKRLGWPGNPHNILFGRGGRFDGRVVCIDAVVQRKPPQTLTSLEDAACEELAELAFNDVGFVKTVLEDALFDNTNSQMASTRGVTMESAAEMQRGMVATWRIAGDLRGIFEMMLRNIDDWIQEFVDDMDNESWHAVPATGSALSPRTRRTLSRTSLLTSKIRLIQREALRGKDELTTVKLDLWNQIFKGRMEELLLALESWLAKRETKAQCGEIGAHLTTGFLNPQTARPFVDLYELGLRLRHVLRRLAILTSALSSSMPSQLGAVSPSPLSTPSPTSPTSLSLSAPPMALSNVFIGCAVAANSFHVLRSLRISHFLNATEDLFVADDSAQFIEREFTVLRIPLRDDEDEDIEPYFHSAAAFIEGAVADGGRCLVHCHAGQSRSCALVIAWLLLYKSFNLRDAIALVQRTRPSAAPNAGYMQALCRLEERTCGSSSRINKLKRPKPEALVCPECGEVVGISRSTLAIHVRKHYNNNNK
jgi:hypothetical protein